jgi:ferredoxin
MAYVIAEPCIGVLDQACVEGCPVDCIYVGVSMSYIHPDECVDCGACELACPVDAIFYEDDIPAVWQHFREANSEFFATLGSPGGASKVGRQEFDAPGIGHNGVPTVRVTREDAVTGASLADRLTVEHRLGNALVPNLSELNRSLKVALDLLFGGVTSLINLGPGRPSESRSSAFELSLSEIVEISSRMISSGRTRGLPPRPWLCGIDEFVGNGAILECKGLPISEVPHIYEREAIGLAGSLVPVLLASRLTHAGVTAHLVTDSFEYATFVRAAVTAGAPERCPAFDPGIVLPDLSEVPLAELSAFREAHSSDIAWHVPRMIELLAENAALKTTDERTRHWAEAHVEIAESGSRIWRLARSAFHSTRRDVALGLTAGLLISAADRKASIVEEFFTAASAEPRRGELAAVFLLTLPGSLDRRANW